MFFMINLLIILGCGALTYFMPQMIWDTTWQTLGRIIEQKDDAAKLTVEISKIQNSLGLTSSNVYQWAVERVVISLLVGFGIMVVLMIIAKVIKNHIAKKNTPTKTRKTSSRTRSRSSAKQ